MQHWINRLNWLAVSITFVLLSLPGISHATSSRCQYDLLQQRDLHVAIQNYKLKRQQLPRSLDQLHESGYRLPLPWDAWGHPYIYHLTENSPGYSLYSKGENGLDEQGGGDDIFYLENRNICKKSSAVHFLIAGGLAVCIIAGLAFFTLRRKMHKQA